MNRTFRIAVAKGRVEDEVRKATRLLPILDNGRALSGAACVESLEYLVVKPWDVPLYVSTGIAHLGIVGNDVLRERNLDVTEVMDTGVASCRLVPAGHPGVTRTMSLRVATKYPNLAKELLINAGYSPALFCLQGSVELAPRVGLAEAIVDLVQTGNTLQANGLVEWMTLLHVSARLVVNPAVWRLEREIVDKVVDSLEVAK